MRMNYSSLLTTLIAWTLFFNIPVSAQNINDNKQQPVTNDRKVYYFGLREDSPPISYKKDFNNWDGYCSVFIDVLQEKTGLTIEKVPVKAEIRFTGKSNDGQKLDAECGNNTITLGRKNKELKENNRDGEFSQPFAWTGAKVLISSQHQDSFYDSSKLSELKIGVINSTTTYNLVKSKYPSLTNKLVILKNQIDAIEKIKNQEINVYYNDEIIIYRTLLELQKTNATKNYVILPNLESHEPYGMIIYNVSNENKELLTQINNLLSEAEFKTFGSTKIKILDHPKFTYFIQDLKLYIPIELNINYYLIIFIIIIVLLVVMILSIAIIRPHTREKINIENNFNNKNLKSHHTSFLYSLILKLIHLIEGFTMPENRKIEITNTVNENKGVVGGYIENLNYQPKEEDLKEAAIKIQQLLKQLEETNPTATEEEKRTFITTGMSPEHKNRLISAIKAGTEAGIEALFDNSYINIAMAIIKGWINPE